MGNDLGKGKYAKMDKVDAASPSKEKNRDEANDNKVSNYAAASTESKNTTISKLSSLKQGINSGYHSIVLSPRSEEPCDVRPNCHNEITE